MLDRTEQRLDLKPDWLTADTAYGTGKLLAWLLGKGMVSRSRMRYRGAWSHGNASVTWREIHSAVGFAVTPNDTQSRRPWRTMTRQYRIWKAIVGRTKRSIAAMPSA